MEARSAPRVVMLLLRSPEWTPFATLVRLAVSFVAAGARLTVFVMDDAILGLVPVHGRGPNSFPLFPVLEAGGEIAVCQSTAEIRGLGPGALPPGVRFETQVQLGQMAGSADLFLPFTA
ncbi:MAG: DsrE family protein [Nitrospirae bacterium]|nr:MAG: hypothetical protein D084_Lepto4C00287G0003 [Leptospirillum sp. Group IV 'UBA BS']MCL4486251.1 DsrE family protein [Nitrospirota bacterium]MCL5284906.1 DsrE family protein [Nitrospirota bacterium]